MKQGAIDQATHDDPHGGGWLRSAAQFVEKRAKHYPSTEADRELIRFHVKAPALLLERLSAYSLTTGQTRTSAIRQALHSWLEERGF
jgi:hypothetical protein